MIVKIPPISVNKVWQGRRFMTKEYKNWRFCFTLLAGKPKIVKGLVEISLVFYIKNYLMVDVDNFAKPVLDALVENEFIEDDRKVIKLNLEKVKSAEEKIIFNIKKYDDKNANN